MPVRIVTDSACDLPEAGCAELGVEVVPLTIRFGDREYVDRKELRTEDFWRELQSSSVLPETAAPSVGAFEETFRRLSDDGADGIVCINLSASLSATMQSANPTASAFYAVNVLNSYGKSAGLSNQVQLPLAPTLPPPSNFREQLTAEGVRLSWEPVSPPTISGIRFAYRVYRREQGSNKDAVAGEVPVGSEPTLLDQSFEWEKTYDYRATVVTVVSPENRTPENRGEQQVEGEDTPAASVVAHDVFPPAIPSGLQAVFSGPGQKPFIDLVWAPNTEPDLAGYNVYRHQPGTQPVKSNSEPVKAPAFRDAAVVSGHDYFYFVSAIDMRGNESEPSPEATETVP